jgi:hypothetical protein
MFIAELEQMQRYGASRDDIGAAMRFARRILSLDREVFPGRSIPLTISRFGGPSSCAQFVVHGDGSEVYVLYVESLALRLGIQGIALMAEHAHRGAIDERTAPALAGDGIALHEVRHRVQHRNGASLRLWQPSDLAFHDQCVVGNILGELSPLARTESEIDARIVEYLYIAQRVAGVDDPVAAVLAEPPQ